MHQDDPILGGRRAGGGQVLAAEPCRRSRLTPPTNEYPLGASCSEGIASAVSQRMSGFAPATAKPDAQATQRFGRIRVRVPGSPAKIPRTLVRAGTRGTDTRCSTGKNR